MASARNPNGLNNRFPMPAGPVQTNKKRSSTLSNPTDKPGAHIELIQCKTCDRKFSHDRIEKHQNICEKLLHKNRKPYDSVKHRWAGIIPDNEIKNIRKSKRPPPLLNSNWREDHNAWSGKSIGAKNPSRANANNNSGLASNDGRILCKGCQRKFSPEAADRHIPYCETKHGVRRN